MKNGLPWVLLSGILWVALMGLSVAVRPPFVVDETRYLAVAWEMWSRGDYLVPHLNGLPYSDKPPLLFWLINAGWSLFGVSEWWARSVAPLSALGTMLLTVRIGRRLWPSEGDAGSLAAVMFLGLAPWAVLGTLTMFDTLVAFCVALSLYGLLVASDGRPFIGWLLYGLGIGLGILAKGPVALVFALPPAVLAPLWLEHRSVFVERNWSRWYFGAAGGLVFGVAIGLAWAIPAARAGGQVYADAILWGQTAGRVVSSFAHGRPFWWYAAIVPAITIPWILWPAFWRGLARMLRHRDAGTRFCLIWFLLPIAILSAVSGKQVHYLLPAMAPLALLIGRISIEPAAVHGRIARLLAAAPFFAIALVLLSVPELRAGRLLSIPNWPQWLGWNAVIVGGVMLAWSGGVVLWRFRTRRAEAVSLASLSFVLVVALQVLVMPAAAPFYSVAETARRIAELTEAGRPVAYLGRTHGQFTFLGRLKAPVPELPKEEFQDWLEKNPNGVLAATHRRMPAAGNEQPLFTENYRSRYLSLWSPSAALANRGLLTE